MSGCKVCLVRKEGVFSDLSKEHLDFLTQHKTGNVYKRGRKLFQEGSLPLGLFCINQGKVKLTKSGQEGNEVILNLYGPGDILGYRSLLSKQPYGATATVIEDALICVIDQLAFYKIISEDSGLAFKMLSRISSELSDAHSRLRDLSNTSVRQRVGELLLFLNQKYKAKVESESGDRIDIRLTRAEMASMLSTTPESVIRTLSDFQSLGLIKLDKKSIYLLNAAGLADEIELSE